MSKMKALAAGSALGAAILAAPAMAAVTGTVAVTSEYVFRGIDSENGAAVQGSIDWSDGGLYVGTWMSNANVAGGNELDIYGGYKFKLTEGVELDLGAIYYIFTEDDDESGLYVFNTDYPEIYAGLNIGGFSGKVYYTNDFFGVDGEPLFFGSTGVLTGTSSGGESTYVNLSYTFPIKESLAFKAAIGSQSGDGAEDFYGDSYVDYALTLTKSLENGFAVSFAAMGTDLEIDGSENTVFAGGAAPFDDEPKFVVTLSKGFEI